MIRSDKGMPVLCAVWSYNSMVRKSDGVNAHRDMKYGQKIKLKNTEFIMYLFALRKIKNK